MKYMLSLLENLRAAHLVFFGGYALYLVFSYMTFHSATLLSAGGEVDFHVQSLFMISSTLTRFVLFVAIAFFVRKLLLKVSVSVLVAAALALACMGFLIAGMIIQFSEIIPAHLYTPWLLLCGTLFGLSDVVLVLLWFRFTITLPERGVYIYVLVCKAASLALYFLATLLPGFLSLPAAAALFIVSALFAKRALDIRQSAQWECSKPVLRGALKSLLHPVLGASILCFMSGLMLQISGQSEIALEDFQQTALLSSAAIVIVLLIPALLVKKPVNVHRMYALAIPLSAAGFLLLPLIWNAAGGIVNSLAQLGAMVANIILWCLLADRLNDTKLPPYQLFSISFACINAALFTGTVVGYLYARVLAPSDVALTAIALVAIYFLLMVALFLFKDKNLNGMEAQGHTEPVREIVQLPSRCEEIARNHRFTPREGEIFLFLAQGYTVTAISSKLYVSENTIKSHVKSIYQKLSIHTRSELIELVNA